MITNRLLCRTARNSSRGGFTLVELLVVIGIIAILAGVALGPITNGIKQAKHNTSMQNARQIGTICFSYSTDNTVNGNAYPSGATSHVVANTLLNSNYCTDPNLFYVNGQPGISAYTPVAGTYNLAATNISWTFTCVTAAATGGITSAASDLIPLIYFSGGTAALATPFPATPGAAKNILTTVNCPFGTDGIAVFYKGNNASYLKAGTTTTAQVDAFISGNCQDTTAYVQLAP